MMGKSALLHHFSILILLSTISLQVISTNRTFTYNDKVFLKDGEPFQYLSGSIHYRRIPKEYWNDRLRKVRALGFNTIQFYLEWNIHEPKPGVYNFEGNANVIEFVQTAMKNDLLVILRPGPFIDGERDMGGLPYWLLTHGSGPVKVRTSDPLYLAAVDSWFNLILNKLKPFLYVNGGPIIMIQVENEYGSFGLQTGNCDTKYLDHLRRTIRNIVGDDVVLFTTDGGGNLNDIRCGFIPETLTTVDFGPSSNPMDQQGNLDNQRLFRPNGPLVNSEFYSGWLDHWGQAHSKTDAEVFARALDWLLERNVSVNVYMIHGGTSFGFEAGANDNPFAPNPTSYDYDAPISEAGDLTQKYEVIKAVVAKHFVIPNIHVSNSTKANYGKIYFEPIESLLSLRYDQIPIHSENPMTFEELNMNSGFVSYVTTLGNQVYPDPSNLEIPKVHDRAYIYVNNILFGKLTRMFGGITNIPLSGLKSGDQINILVENLGRVCFGPTIGESKGIIEGVTLNKAKLTNWTMSLYPLDNITKLSQNINSIASESYRIKVNRQFMKIAKPPENMGIYYGSIKISCQNNVASDTFIKFSNSRKGVLWINGINLGRYWPALGPQVTLYLPGPFLKCNAVNEFIILETDSPSRSRSKLTIDLIDTPLLDGPVP